MTETVEKSLKIATAVLVAFVAGVLALAEGGPIPAVTLPIVVVTLMLIDLQGRLAIPVIVLTFAGILGFVAAITEFFTGGTEARILSGAHLLVYLTWVFLLLKKQERDYWWLILLSVLQVAVASVLTDTVWFGLALLMFGLMLTATLTLLLLHRNLVAALSGQAIIERSRDMVQRDKSVNLDGARTRAGISQALSGGSLSSRLAGSTLAITCWSVALAALIFFLTPRIRPTRLALFGDTPLGVGRSLTGFTDQVKLGDMGEILESNESAMQIRVFGPGGDQLSAAEATAFLGTDPLFRGAVLNVYSEGEWDRGDVRGRLEITNQQVPNAYRLEVRLDPIGVRTLFSFGNTVGITTPDSESIWMNPYVNEFRRTRDDDLDRSFTYNLWVVPGEEDSGYAEIRNLLSREFRYSFGRYLAYLVRPQDGLEQLAEIARKAADGATTEREAADRLRAYLQDNKEFSYSMNLTVVDPNVDPVIDFLVNRKQGHCEYYSSAYVLMARSVGLPARVISGFKGAAYDTRRNVFNVQQLHAHTWAEVFYDDRWHTIDPTPPERDAIVQGMQSTPTFYESLTGGFSSMWNLGARMSQTQQRDMIYQPLQTAATGTVDVIRGVLSGNQETLQEIRKFFSNPGEWVSVSGGIVAFVLMTLASGLVWLLRKLYVMLSIFRARYQETAVSEPRVPFYERFRSILEKEGLYQGMSQTAREFAQQAAARINEPLVTAGLSGFPPELIEKFYLVRFGTHDLSTSEEEEIETRLTALERVLTARRNDRKASGKA